MAVVHDNIVGITSDEDTVLDGDDSGTTIVIKALDRIHVQDDAVVELRAVVEVYEKLDRNNVVVEVFHVNVSYFSKDSGHPFLLEAFDKKFMIYSNKLRHYVNGALSNYLLFRSAEYLACNLVAIFELSNGLIVLVRENCKC